MKLSLKNWSFRSKQSSINKAFTLLLVIILSITANSQIANYVSNGSFEELKDCNGQNSNKVKYWSSIDTTKFSYYIMNKCFNNVPGLNSNFQYPKEGNGFVGGTFFCGGLCDSIHNRSYFRNKMKSTLVSNTVYCVKFYVNLRNSSPYGIDAIGVYFGNSTLDTINYCDTKITYLNPQIQNATGNVILDTVNWISVSGTFTANGTEKFLVIGNFKKDNNITITQVGTSTDIWSDLYIDDVSCIALNMPSYAGSDVSIFAGDSVFLGRQPDVGIDEACIWYKLTSPTTSITIDTIAGFWVKPVTTTTYVLRQEICSLVKWDTVVVHMNAVGLEKLKLLSEELKVYPIPAQDFLELKITNAELFKEFNSIRITNNLGQVLREEEINFKEIVVKINTGDLPSGIYFITISNSNNEKVTKKLVIAK